MSAEPPAEPAQPNDPMPSVEENVEQRLQHVVDDEPTNEGGAPTSDEPSADELDGLRIRQLATLRRGAYRSRSHAVIAMIVCAVATAELGTTAWMRVRAIGWTSVPLLCIAMIPVALWGAIHFYRRASVLHREATRSLQAGPTEHTSPDFTTLGDGSERWDRLNDVR
jgi:hypothetical protein